MKIIKVSPEELQATIASLVDFEALSPEARERARAAVLAVEDEGYARCKAEWRERLGNPGTLHARVNDRHRCRLFNRHRTWATWHGYPPRKFARALAENLAEFDRTGRYYSHVRRAFVEA